MNTAFIFPGQGSQAVSMGKDLYDNYPVAKEIFEKVDETLKQNLSSIIFEGPLEDLTKTENTQPALMAVSVAFLEAIKKETGKEINELCKYVAGHSVGEYSALVAAGSLSVENAAKILRIRGQEMQNSFPKGEGAMAAILGLKIDDLESIIKTIDKGICDIANDNTESQIVVSGDQTGIDEVSSKVKNAGGKAIKLNVSGPFHSRLMEKASIAMESHLKEININKPKVPAFLNVTSQESTDPEQIRQSLISQVAGRVRWRETIINMSNNGVDNLVEIGSGRVLTNMIKKSSVEISLTNVGNVVELGDFLSLIS